MSYRSCEYKDLDKLRKTRNAYNKRYYDRTRKYPRRRWTEEELDMLFTADMTDNELAEIRNNMIGFIFQQYNLLPKLDVLENVEVPLVYAGLSAGERHERAAHALERVGLGKKLHNKPSQLSGGQQQRVALARTLAQNPQIILADEPVASLDPVTAKQVMDDFRRINREMHITVLINIHHVELALQYATRVIGIRAGEIVYDGPANQVDQAVLDSIYQGKQEEPA